MKVYLPPFLFSNQPVTIQTCHSSSPDYICLCVSIQSRLPLNGCYSKIKRCLTLFSALVHQPSPLCNKARPNSSCSLNYGVTRHSLGLSFMPPSYQVYFSRPLLDLETLLMLSGVGGGLYASPGLLLLVLSSHLNTSGRAVEETSNPA